jgi:hypothetical protein
MIANLVEHVHMSLSDNSRHYKCLKPKAIVRGRDWTILTNRECPEKGTGHLTNSENLGWWNKLLEIIPSPAT